MVARKLILGGTADLVLFAGIGSRLIRDDREGVVLAIVLCQGLNVGTNGSGKTHEKY